MPFAGGRTGRMPTSTMTPTPWRGSSNWRISRGRPCRTRAAGRSAPQCRTGRSGRASGLDSRSATGARQNVRPPPVPPGGAFPPRSIAAAATIVVALVVAGAIFRPGCQRSPGRVADSDAQHGSRPGAAAGGRLGPADDALAEPLVRRATRTRAFMWRLCRSPPPGGCGGRRRSASTTGGCSGSPGRGESPGPGALHHDHSRYGRPSPLRVARIEQTAGTLHVSLTGSDIAPAEQPRPLGDDERIRFWWLQDDSIDVLLAPFPPD